MNRNTNNERLRAKICPRIHCPYETADGVADKEEEKKGEEKE